MPRGSSRSTTTPGWRPHSAEIRRSVRYPSLSLRHLAARHSACRHDASWPGPLVTPSGDALLLPKGFPSGLDELLLGEQPVLHGEEARRGPGRRVDLHVDVLDVVA